MDSNFYTIGDLAKVLDSFPEKFGLQHFPGKVFRVSRTHSYISSDLGIQIVVDILSPEGTWLNFSRGTEHEVKEQMEVI